LTSSEWLSASHEGHCSMESAGITATYDCAICQWNSMLLLYMTSDIPTRQKQKCLKKYLSLCHLHKFVCDLLLIVTMAWRNALLRDPVGSLLIEDILVSSIPWTPDGFITHSSYKVLILERTWLCVSQHTSFWSPKLLNTFQEVLARHHTSPLCIVSAPEVLSLGLLQRFQLNMILEPTPGIGLEGLGKTTRNFKQVVRLSGK